MRERIQRLIGVPVVTVMAFAALLIVGAAPALAASAQVMRSQAPKATTLPGGKSNTAPRTNAAGDGCEVELNGDDTITHFCIMHFGDWFRSGTGKAFFIFQDDGNLVDYDENLHPRWDSKTTSRGGYAAFQADGNLVVYSPSGMPLWASGTCCYPDFTNYLAVQGDGNVVIYRGDGVPLWETGTTH